MFPEFTFGVYPYGLAGGPDGLAAGVPDDPAAIRRAVERLGGEDHTPLLVRAYVGWSGPESSDLALEQIADHLELGFPLDLVLAYRDEEGRIGGWCDFVAAVTSTFGCDLEAIQITGEANLSGVPHAGDGSYPGVIEALARGVLTARAVKVRTSATALGFAVVPESDPCAGTFWPELHETAGPLLADCLDYVGIDMYPDVFGGPVSLADLDEVVEDLLATLRTKAMPMIGAGEDVAIRVCENGWPTGPSRYEVHQELVLDSVLRCVHDRRLKYGVTHWELFALRDADSAGPSLFHHFGVLRDDYSRKPAFDRLRRTIAELRSVI